MDIVFNMKKTHLFSRFFVRLHPFSGIVGDKLGVLQSKGFFRQHRFSSILLQITLSLLLFQVGLSTASAFTWTATAGATLDTTTKKFGAGSYAFAAKTDDITTPDSTSFEPSGNFTWELWVYPTANSINGIMTHIPSGSFGLGMALYNGAGAPRPYASIGNAACNDWLFSGNPTTATLSLNNWHHIFLMRSGNDYYFGHDGTQTASFLNSSETPCAPAVGIYIGDQNADNNGITGNIDDVRFSSVARYGTDITYTVPTSAFCYDADTVSLLHLDVDTSEDVSACAAGGAATRTIRRPIIIIPQ